MSTIIYSPLIILGSGPAGYTAAIYAARANLKPLLLTGMASGGQLMTTTHVDNWPADAQGVLGPDLMQRFEEHARRFGTTIQFDHVDQVALTHDAHNNISSEIGMLLDNWDSEWITKDYKILISGSAVYICSALIISTGASAKYLGLPSEEEYMGRGVSGCATCDGFFYKDQEVAVVGGGNTAVEEALYLSKIASKVHLVHRRDTFRAEAIMVDHLMSEVQSGRIVLHLHQEIEEILGNEGGVHGIRLKHQNGSLNDLSVAGVFIAIGHHPNTTIFEDQLILKHGYIVTNGYGHPEGAGSTNIPGVYAAGDCQDSIYRQAITSAGSGCAAALDAARYLQEHH